MPDKRDDSVEPVTTILLGLPLLASYLVILVPRREAGLPVGGWLFLAPFTLAEEEWGLNLLTNWREVVRLYTMWSGVVTGWLGVVLLYAACFTTNRARYLGRGSLALLVLLLSAAICSCWSEDAKFTLMTALPFACFWYLWAARLTWLACTAPH